MKTTRSIARKSLLRPLALLLMAAMWMACGAEQASAQFGRQSAVGGVSIDVDGILANMPASTRDELRKMREKALAKIPSDMNATAKLRKVSLKRLEAALADFAQGRKTISDELKHLAGLQRIQYVFVYPEEHDIVLAGPGEGWRIDDQGEVVGRTTGKPVMHLDDLLVALRAAAEVRSTGISCSIDPTAEGLKKLKSLAGSLRTIGTNRAATVASLEQALGPQTITVSGIPADTHFAAVIVAADYKMKRLAMGFDKSPVAGMRSFLEIAEAGPTGMKNMMPRWWLAPDYEALHTDRERLAFELRGGSVKALAEQDFFSDAGARAATGKADAAAQQWATSMSDHYAELADKEPVFAQLRNCMDVAVVATLIVKHRLDEKAGLELSLMGDAGQLPTENWFPPKQVDSQASLVKKGRNWLISVSGGVKFQPWLMVEKTLESNTIAPVRASANSAAASWWWN